MRSSIWMLAICAFAWGAVSAQERVADRQVSPFDPPATGRTIEYFSRDGENAKQAAKSPVPESSTARLNDKNGQSQLSTKSPKRDEGGSLRSKSTVPSASSPKVRNYYEELFGKGGAVPESNTRRNRIAGNPQSIKLQPVSPAETSRGQQAVRPAGIGVAQESSGRQSEKNPFDPFAAENVTQADHKTSSLDDAGKIAPVAATSDDNPFRNFDPNVTTTEAKESAPDGDAFAPDADSDGQEPLATGFSVQAAELAHLKIEAAAHGAQSPSVTVEWVTRGEISVGHECECDLVVRNHGKATAHDIVVNAWFPYSVRLLKTTPKPSATSDYVTWSFEELAPGQKQTIQITMVPNERGSLEVTANVRFTAAASEALVVVEPLLSVELKSPAQAMVGDLVPQVITVSNPGSGIAHNVIVEVRIPEGLEHSRGAHLLTEVGSLNPGESRDLTLRMTAVTGGKHSVQVEARAGDELTQATVSEINIIAPSLSLVADGPTLRYLGREAKYTVSVNNDGTTATNNVRVLYKVPQGFKFLKADHGGKYDESSRTISWFVGRLAPAETFALGVELSADQLGEFVHYIRTVSEQGANSDTKIETRVEGTASLVLEIVDLDDPVEVGTETGYEIRVHNDGSAIAQNIGISCELPNGTEIVDVKGPSSHIAENGVVIFKSLSELPPGKTALYRVHLRGTDAGDLRFRARLTSESIQEPLIVEELTKFYAD